MNTPSKKGGLRSVEKALLYLLVVLLTLSMAICVATALPREWYKGIQPEILSNLTNGSHALITGIGATIVLYAYILIVIHTSGKKYIPLGPLLIFLAIVLFVMVLGWGVGINEVLSLLNVR